MGWAVVVMVVVGGGVGSSGDGVSLQLIHTHLTHKVGRIYSKGDIYKYALR